MSAAVAQARQVLATHSKSFALAGKLLPRWCRDDAAVVYAWCRRADDAVDLATPAEARAAVRRLEAELDAVYGPDAPDDPVLGAFADVVRRCRIPRAYPQELLSGMAMDARGTRYDTLDDLLLYCFRAAGTVGLMMAHVMRVRDPASLSRAAHLGMAMQITNVCRDVAEDAGRGRIYLPSALLGQGRDGQGLCGRRAARAIRMLLVEARHLYRSGHAGLGALPWRCAIAIRTAGLVYAAIGDELARRGWNPSAGRAFVPTWKKVLLAARAVVAGVGDLPRRLVGRWRAEELPEVRYTDELGLV